MNYNEMFNAVQEAERVVRLSDQVSNRMAQFIVNRLRFVNASTLREIKAELKKFNSVTGEWK